MSAEFILRAMARNYNVNSLWDEIDAKACFVAADEISKLRAENIALALQVKALRDALAVIRGASQAAARFKDLQRTAHAALTAADNSAALVRADERERCAKVCDEARDGWRAVAKGCHNGQYDHMADAAEELASDIRAMKDE